MATYEAPDAAINAAIRLPGVDGVIEACRIAVVAEFQTLMIDAENERSQYPSLGDMATGMSVVMNSIEDRLNQLGD